MVRLRIIDGLFSSACAIPKRCFIPPEYDLTFLSAASVRFTMCKSSSVRDFTFLFSIPFTALHHENNMVRLRIVAEAAPTADAYTVEPSLEDLFLYHFGEDTQFERGEEDENID